jgi:hypothetical protein
VYRAYEPEVGRRRQRTRTVYGAKARDAAVEELSAFERQEVEQLAAEKEAGAVVAVVSQNAPWGPSGRSGSPSGTRRS